MKENKPITIHNTEGVYIFSYTLTGEQTILYLPLHRNTRESMQIKLNGGDMQYAI